MSAPARVLVVEDSSAYAHLVGLLLDELLEEPVVTRHAGTLAAALETLAVASADVVLTDLSLPDAQGLDAVDRLRAAQPGLAVVVLSGRDESGLVAELAGRGIAFVAKGDELAQLGAAVGGALRRRA